MSEAVNPEVCMLIVSPWVGGWEGGSVGSWRVCAVYGVAFF
jgi:hypothetical protein